MKKSNIYHPLVQNETYYCFHDYDCLINDLESFDKSNKSPVTETIIVLLNLPIKLLFIIFRKNYSAYCNSITCWYLIKMIKAVYLLLFQTKAFQKVSSIVLGSHFSFTDDFPFLNIFTKKTLQIKHDEIQINKIFYSINYL